MDNEDDKIESDGTNKKTETVAETDDEDDCGNYFLQPVTETINVAEKIAQANKQLFEEEEKVEEKEEKAKKVQFSDDLVNFEPDIDYESMESTIESTDQSFLEEDKLKWIPEGEHEEELGCIQSNEENKENILPKSIIKGDDITAEPDDEIPEEIHQDIPKSSEKHYQGFNSGDGNEENPKLLLILIPQEQNSSCESIIGEDILKNEHTEEDSGKNINDGLVETEKVIKTKMNRPKSASGNKYKKLREVPKISPTLNCCPSFERKAWQMTKNPMPKFVKKTQETCKKKERDLSVANGPRSGVKKINIDTPVFGNFSMNLKRCDERPKSSFKERDKSSSENRPKTAPVKRNCCVIKSKLPLYNGLRSEYGLSAEQLQERKQATLQVTHQRKQEKQKERQEMIKKKAQNEEVFQKWLLGKKEKPTLKKNNKTSDTLTRSDVYIQSHASYASNKNVPYSVNCNLTRKIRVQVCQSKDKNNRKIVLDKLFDKMSPHYKKSFNIYLGVT